MCPLKGVLDGMPLFTNSFSRYDFSMKPTNTPTKGNDFCLALVRFSPHHQPNADAVLFSRLP